MSQEHIPVLLKESIDGLKIRPDGIYVDGTLGMGGHSEAIAERLQGGLLIAVDRDDEALEKARKRLERFGDKIHFIHGNFADLPAILDDQGVALVDGMLFDFGVSSPQLDEPERGFSYMHDAPLDMRMDRTDTISAWLLVNRWPEKKLETVLKDFGEERFARRIAERIVEERKKYAINSTLQLADIVKKAMPPKALREKQHPAKRTFQALRIAVNDELGSIDAMMATAPDRLKVGGRLAVISFHSLEDRIVKKAIASRENGCTCPREAPVCTCGFVQTLKTITRKPITAGEDEVRRNPRARSAKLRIAERV
jgi:16S rRNA (cytosine1402-N4)-methyltransferase